jgi:hypothetical protein
LDLLHHPEHVPVLPSFDQLVARVAHDSNAGDVDVNPARGHAESFAGVLGGKWPSDAYLVPVRHDFLDVRVDLGERGAETVEERIETVRANDVGIAFVKYGLG